MTWCGRSHAPDLILATGHLGRDDAFAVVEAAFAEGVKEVVVTHPEFPCQDFSLEDQAGSPRALSPRALPDDPAERQDDVGARVRRRARGGHRADDLLERLRKSRLSRGRGRAALWADRLLAAAFDEDEVRAMIVTHSRRLAGDE